MDKTIYVAKTLKFFAVIIILIAIYVFIDLQLWINEHSYDVANLCKVFLPIMALGFSGTLYGIATLIEMKQKNR